MIYIYNHSNDRPSYSISNFNSEKSGEVNQESTSWLGLNDKHISNVDSGKKTFQVAYNLQMESSLSKMNKFNFLLKPKVQLHIFHTIYNRYRLHDICDT